ncbi:MAG: efflux RND transporter permease subunit [Planctomycetes bacterium]|nr:efflux RND transporter permease subunit [Planctomycetota bacterium]
MSQREEPRHPPPGGSLTQRIVEVFLTGNLSPLLLLLSLAAGAVALLATPREEDPQIVVPVADLVVDAPGCSAAEVERQVTIPLEQVVRRIDGIEHVYSMSRRNQAVVTARFYVGEDREDSLVKLHSTLQRHADEIPPQVGSWVVKPVSIDDVPILAVTLHSATLDDHALRRVAEEIGARLQQVPESGQIQILGGRPRRLQVQVDGTALASRGLGFAAVERALAAASVGASAGSGPRGDREIAVEATPVAPDALALGQLVIGVQDGQPVHLRDVATVRDGPAEVASHVRYAPGAAQARAAEPPRAAVTLAVAKRRGANAVTVAETLRERLMRLRAEVLPSDVDWTVTRDSGRTADAKVDELVESLAVAIAIVVVLITLMLGWREAIVVALAVPITFGLTLLVNLLAGYSINRVTLFALILALGLVVDDPIVDVENIHRHLQRRPRDPLRAVLDAVNEVRPPVIVATLAVILSFLPLFFITGMMGPYMAPMALNVPMAMLMSMVVAFTLTPWMSYLALRRAAPPAPSDPAAAHAEAHSEAHPVVQRLYRAAVGPLLRSARTRWAVFGATVLLFAGALALGALRAVPLKMLPFDNKTELQVLADLPEGATLERTQAVVSELAEQVRVLPEVVDVTAYAGTPSPMDFNGMVRKYYLRSATHQGELRVQLVAKHDRQHQSHEVALRIRAILAPLAAAAGAVLQVVELPPGPPVLATLVAEVRGPPTATPADLDAAALLLAARLREEPGVTDLDTSVEARPDELHYVLDHEKAALHGVSAADTAAVLRTAVAGTVATVLHAPREVRTLAVEVRVPVWQRADAQALGELCVRGADGTLVPLAEIGRFVARPRETTIHRKDLERVAYVLAEAAGRPPAEIVLDVQADLRSRGASPAQPPGLVPLERRTLLAPGAGMPWSLPDGFHATWTGEGEWQITLDAFRDLGLAFLAACAGIYVLLVHETRSYTMPLVLMLAIPFTILGILPGFWLLNLLLDAPVAGVANPVFFTATAMIGMIALAGIAVRNSILLIDFIEGALRQGMPLEEAILRSGAVRLRPIVLTAGAAILAAIPITLDPIFSGLAWALIFGLVVSSLFTLVLVPVVYRGIARHRTDAQDPQAAAEGGDPG